MPGKVLVSVLSYDDPESAAAALRSVLAQDAPCDALVVDNGSRPDRLAALRRGFPGVRFLESPVNLGYGGGNNLALDLAAREGYEAALLCNDDLLLPPEAVGLLREAEAALPGAGALGGVELDGSGREVVSEGGTLTWWTGRVRWTRGWAASGQSSARRVFCPQGSLLYFTRAGLKAGLRLDASLGLYCEEMALGHALAAAGLSAFVHLGLRYRHASGGNRRAPGLSARNAYYIARNRVWVSRRALGPARYAAFLACYAAELAAKVPLRLLASPPGFVANTLRGARDGLFPSGVARLPL